MRIVCGLLLSVILVGCGFEQPNKTGTVSGFARPLAAVEARDLHGQSLGSAVARADGYFQVALDGPKPQVLKLTASGGEYYAPGSEFPTRIADTFKTHSVVNYVNGRDNKTRIDFWTTLSAGLAEYQIKTGKAADEAVVSAEDVLEAWTSVTDGFSVRSLPIDAGSSVRKFTDEDASQIAAMNELTPDSKLVFLNASLFALVGGINKHAKLEGDARVTVHQFAIDAYEDIKNDGVLNGILPGRTLTYGGVIVDVDRYRHELAIALVETLQSELNRTKVTSSQAAQWIISINEYTGTIFGNNQPKQIPEDRPYLEFGGLEEGKEQSGLKVVGYRAVDFAGMESIRLEIDSERIPLIKDGSSFTLDTSNYKNEVYEVRLVALNKLGAETAIVKEILFRNQIDNNFTLSPDGALVSKEVELAVTLGDQFGIEKVEFFVDGNKVYETTDIKASISHKIDTATLPAGDGEHTFRANIISNSGNISFKTSKFNTDNTPPGITWELAEGKLLDRIERFQASVVEDQALKSVEMLYDGNVLRNFANVEGKKNYEIDLSLDTRTIREGQHTMAIRAESLAGVSSLETKGVYVDWNNPVVNIVTPSGSRILKGQTVQAEFQVLDTNGVKKVEYFIDDQLQGDVPVGTNRISISNSTGLVKNSVLKVVATDLAGRTASDSILIRYQVLSLNPPNMQIFENGRAKLSFTLYGVESAVFTPIFSLTDPIQSGMYTDDVTLAVSYNPATEIGTVDIDFPAATYSGVGCGVDWKLMKYSLLIRYRGQESNIITGASDVGGVKAYIHRPTTGCAGGSGAPKE